MLVYQRVPVVFVESFELHSLTRGLSCQCHVILVSQHPFWLNGGRGFLWGGAGVGCPSEGQMAFLLWLDASSLATAWFGYDQILKLPNQYGKGMFSPDHVVPKVSCSSDLSLQ